MTQTTTGHAAASSATQPNGGSGAGGSTTRAAADAIREGVGAAKEWAGDKAQIARTWAAGRTDQIRDAVTDEPVMVIGVSAAVAFAAGLAAGLLVGRLTAD